MDVWLQYEPSCGRTTHTVALEGMSHDCGHLSSTAIHPDLLTLQSQPDSHARHCDSSRCATTFSFFERRHHCRKCGLVFCNTHTPHAVPLDELARFHTEGFRVRACDECWDDYRAWETLRCSRNNSYSDESSLQNSPPTPGEGIAFTRSRMGGKGRAMMHGKKGPGQGPGMGESVGTSVPRNWEWSTF